MLITSLSRRGADRWRAHGVRPIAGGELGPPAADADVRADAFAVLAATEALTARQWLVPAAILPPAPRRRRLRRPRAARPRRRDDPLTDRRASLRGMPLRVWRIGLTEVTCDGCGREERREERPSGYHLLLKLGWQERPTRSRSGRLPALPEPVELLCPQCAAKPG